MELLSIQETFVPIQNHTFFSTTTHKEKNENGKRPAFFHQEGGSTFGWGVGRKRIFFNRDVPIVCVCGQCTSVKACNIPVRYYVTQKGVHKCSFPWWHRNATGYKSCPCWWWMMDWHLFLHSTHNNNQVVVVVEGLSSNMRAKLLLLRGSALTWEPSCCCCWALRVPVPVQAAHVVIIFSSEKQKVQQLLTQVGSTRSRARKSHPDHSKCWNIGKPLDLFNLWGTLL